MTASDRPTGSAVRASDASRLAEYARAESVATNEQRYRKEWATLTGRSESEVYVPKGIRDDRDADPLPASEASGDRAR